MKMEIENPEESEAKNENPEESEAKNQNLPLLTRWGAVAGVKLFGMT